MKKRILVTGGAGYIGSHTAWLLTQQGYEVVIVDALLHGQNFLHTWATFIPGRIPEILPELFSRYTFHAVMHFAAHIEVAQSCTSPRDYYLNNVVATQALLDACLKAGTKKFIFSSSCAIYGNPLTDTLSEDHPHNPLSPYGNTKHIVELLLKDYSHAYQLEYVSLRYFNAAGGLPEYGLYEQHHPETHLIPLLIKAIKNGSVFNVYGSDYPTPDGTALRDYVHVLDIADAHIKALRHLEITGSSDVFNLGTGTGHSVLQVIQGAQEVIGQKAQFALQPRRPGDATKLVANAAKAQTILKWYPRYSSLESILISALGHELHKLVPKNAITSEESLSR